MFVGIVCVFGNASQAWNCRCTVIFCGALIMDWLGGVVRMGDAPSSCHFGTTLSRKLASASWSPSCISCFSKYGGSWNLTSHETPTLFLLFFGSYGRKIPCAQCWWKVGSVGLLLKKNSVLNMVFLPPPSEPPPLAGSQAVWPWLNPPRGHRWHVAGSKNGSICISIMFSCQAPCQASFRPLPLGLKFFNHEIE